jgi:hypothetical protein
MTLNEFIKFELYLPCILFVKKEAKALSYLISCVFKEALNNTKMIYNLVQKEPEKMYLNAQIDITIFSLRSLHC